MKMKWVTVAARVLMGLGFLGAGVSFFLTTPPPPPEGPLNDFFKGLVASGYFLNLLKGTEIVCALMLLSGRFVPLALVVLAPITLNIVLVHAFMEPSTIFTGLILGALQVYLAFFSKEYSGPIKQLFKPNQTV